MRLISFVISVLNYVWMLQHVFMSSSEYVDVEFWVLPTVKVAGWIIGKQGRHIRELQDAAEHTPLE